MRNIGITVKLKKIFVVITDKFTNLISNITLTNQV